MKKDASNLLWIWVHKKYMKTTSLRETYNPLNMTVRNWPQIACCSHLSYPPFLSNKHPYTLKLHYLPTWNVLTILLTSSSNLCLCFKSQLKLSWLYETPDHPRNFFFCMPKLSVYLLQLLNHSNNFFVYMPIYSSLYCQCLAWLMT